MLVGDAVLPGDDAVVDGALLDETKTMAWSTMILACWFGRNRWPESFGAEMLVGTASTARFNGRKRCTTGQYEALEHRGQTTTKNRKRSSPE